jgi:hypothetical protein
VSAIQATLEAAVVEFLEGDAPDVWLRPNKKKRKGAAN